MNAELVEDCEALWEKSTEIGEIIRHHMGREHQEHFYLMCQLQFLSLHLIPELDRFYQAALPAGPIQRIDLWHLGDKLLNGFIEIKEDLAAIDRRHAERQGDLPAAL